MLQETTKHTAYAFIWKENFAQEVGSCLKKYIDLLFVVEEMTADHLLSIEDVEKTITNKKVNVENKKSTNKDKENKKFQR